MHDLPQQSPLNFFSDIKSKSMDRLLTFGISCFEITRRSVSSFIIIFTRRITNILSFAGMNNCELATAGSICLLFVLLFKKIRTALGAYSLFIVIARILFLTNHLTSFRWLSFVSHPYCFRLFPTTAVFCWSSCYAFHPTADLQKPSISSIRLSMNVIIEESNSIHFYFPQ